VSRYTQVCFPLHPFLYFSGYKHILAFISSPSPASIFTGKVELKVFDKIRVGIRVAEGKAAHRDAVVYTLQSPRIPGLDVEREEGARNVEGGGKKRKSADAKKK